MVNGECVEVGKTRFFLYDLWVHQSIVSRRPFFCVREHICHLLLEKGLLPAGSSISWPERVGFL